MCKWVWTDQLDGPAGRTSWTDQLNRPAGRTRSFYLKPWPVCLFKDWPFSFYIVTASESDEGLVCLLLSQNSGSLGNTLDHLKSLLSTKEHPWSLLTSHEHLWALMSIIAACSWVLMVACELWVLTKSKKMSRSTWSQDIAKLSLVPV